MKSVLIVAEPTKARHRFSKTLSEAGYQVTEADTGESALIQAASSPPDLVLMTIVMPGLNGLQTSARFRSTPTLKSLPIVLLGSLPPLGINEEPLATMVDGYLGLEASAEELLAFVSRYVGALGAGVTILNGFALAF